MSMVIYYFTRSGSSEKQAKELAATYGADVYKIEDNKNWNGIIGFIKAGYYSSNKKSIPAVYRRPQEGEHIVLVSPLWAGTFPPAVRTFIDDISRNLITIVVKSGGSKLKDRDGFVKVIDAIGLNPTITL